MIETLKNIAKMLVAILPFLLLCLAGRKVNLPKADRSRQFLMPVIVIVYAVAAMLLMNKVNDWLLGLLDALPKWVAALGNLSWMPAGAGAVFTSLSGLLTRLLESLNLHFWVFFLANTVMILVYLTVKKLCLGIIAKAVKPDGELHAKAAGWAYEYSADRDMWCLKENYVQARSLLKVFYYSAVVLSAVLMLVSRRFYFDGLMRSVFYPVFGILIVGELYFYLDGATKREYISQILGEDEDVYQTVNYSLLRKFLRSIFGDKLLTENTGINNALAYDVTTDDIIRELEKSEDPKTASFAAYMGSLNRTGFRIDHNYLHSSLDMLNGKSILFNNPFYHDLIPYAFYPMNRALLSHQKVLVVAGRHSIEPDIEKWLEEGIEAVTNIPFMWNIGVLNSQAQDLDIGIITRSDVLNMALHNANAAFLEEVGFCVIIEPSKLISTAQIGLNLLVKKCRTDEEKPIVYCLCDKNCDGLVDAMSHILMTSLTEVSATEKHLGTSSYMCWEADGEYLHHRLVPNISRYLGVGTELSFAALKNQVSKTRWFGGEAFPVTDMRWIAKQYYYDLTRYAGLPTSQEAMDEHFLTSANFWSAEVEKNGYLTVEDESCNMFEILRDFSTRTTEQGFINVISSEYLLKDYMADNASIFEADAKAVPFIVADYTRSNRNTILRLVLMMSTFPVSEELLEKEFSLLGVPVFDLKKQLWYELYLCYSAISRTAALPEDYPTAVSAVYGETLRLGEAEWSHDILRAEETFNLKSGKMETTYSIADPAFLTQCVAELRSAGYVAEDEKGERYYLGSELSGHIYQKYLPGQFFTFGGKYYEMQYLTADGQILVRRAADHITGRPAYRQIREYVIQGVKPSQKIGARQNIAGLTITKEFADICVETRGYYRMERYQDFATAKRVAFEGEKNGIPQRIYHNKEILCLELPALGGRLTDSVRYTITVLFNEIFKTLFAENQAYICAVTDETFLADEEGERPLTYSVRGEGCELRPGAIYIIEDSQLDLGLTVAVERNLQRIFHIVCDYLDWHLATLEASLNPPPDPLPPIVFTTPDEAEKPQKKGLRGLLAVIGGGVKKIRDWFRRRFGKKSPAEPVPSDGEVPAEGEVPADGEVPAGEPTVPEKAPADSNTPSAEPTPEKTDSSAAPENEPAKKGLFGWFRRRRKKTDVPEPAGSGTPDEETGLVPEEAPVPSAGTGETGIAKEPVEQTQAPYDGGMTESPYPEGERTGKAGFSVERQPYHERYYLLYGRESEFPFMDVSAALEYLAAMGMRRNPLKQARENKNVAALVEATYKPGKPDARYCDFCGAEIFGVEYETLADGRDRCLACGRTAIKTGEEFRRVFADVKRNMESFFGIRIRAGIRVEMVNAKTLHRRLGQAFIPTPKSDGRVLGVAIKDKNGYTLLVENGSPRMASMLTMAHELTHIWQYIHWNDKAIIKKYGRRMRLEIYEGMAKWVEIQYAYLINEPAVAKREEIMTSVRDDEYGHGFLRYRANYPFSLGTVITRATPFLNPETPLEEAFCGPFTLRPPTDGSEPGGDGSEPPAPDGDTPVSTGPIQGPIERDPGTLSRYAYHLLNEEEKAVYQTVLEAITRFQPEVTDFPATVTDEQMRRISDYIQRDHPELFWFQHGATFFFDPTTHAVSKLSLSYRMTQEEAQKRQSKIDAAVRPFLTSIREDMSDYEVTLHLYENIIKLVDYDTVGLAQQKAAADPSGEPDDLRSIYGVFVNKKAVCAGYAKAMQYLLNLCGLECTYVTSETHAWNLLRLEGDYYHLDVTWGDSSETGKERSRSETVSYDCFCITTEELSRLKAHTPQSDFPLPVCTATKCNYHRRHGLFFEKFDFDRVRAIVCESVRYRRLEVSLKFASRELFDEAKKQLVGQGRFWEAMQYAGLKSGIRLSPRYRYTVREELFTITFLMEKL